MDVKGIQDSGQHHRDTDEDKAFDGQLVIAISYFQKFLPRMSAIAAPDRNEEEKKKEYQGQRSG